MSVCLLGSQGHSCFCTSSSSRWWTHTEDNKRRNKTCWSAHTHSNSKDKRARKQARQHQEIIPSRLAPQSAKQMYSIVLSISSQSIPVNQTQSENPSSLLFQKHRHTNNMPAFSDSSSQTALSGCEKYCTIQPGVQHPRGKQRYTNSFPVRLRFLRICFQHRRFILVCLDEILAGLASDKRKTK